MFFNKKSSAVKVPDLEVDPYNKFSKKQQVMLQKEGYDLDWLSQIQPQGGMFFGERQGETSDGYFQCLEVTKYDNDPVVWWLAEIMNYSYTICTADLKTDPKDKLIKDLNRGMDELSDREVEAAHQTERSNAKAEKKKMLAYAQELSRKGEVAKQVRIRVFIYAPTVALLEQRTQDIKTRIQNNGYKVTNFLFEPYFQYKSLFMNLDEQNTLMNNREPYSMPAKNIGGGIPFHHQALMDPKGYPYGQTLTGGSFIFDPFFKSRDRLAYNGAVLGTMGAGKSNYLKMMEEAMVGAHNMVRGIDIAGDFKQLITSQNGSYVPLDGSGGLINPLEVMGTVLDQGNLKIDQAQSFNQHISHVGDQFRFLNPAFTADDLTELRIYLHRFYEAIGLVPENYEQDSKFQITDLPANKYPTLTDFYNWLMRQSVGNQATFDKKRTLEKIQTSLQDIISNYGYVFDGHSTVKNLSHEQIVYFGAGNLQSLSREVFHCQLYTALTIIWNHALQNGIRVRQNLKSGKIKNGEETYCLAILDECHNIINTNMIFAVQYVSRFEREMRKNYAGVWFATQSPEEMIPEGANSSDASTIKTVLQFTTYKFLMRTDPATIPAIKRLLGNSITKSEYEKLGTLKVGQAVCNFGKNINYTVKFNPDKEQLKRFDGGL